MLSIRNLSHRYPNGVQALTRVHLDIPKGMFGLLGPNGAGKSSLMRTLATLQQPTTGTIRFNEIDVLQQAERLRRTLGYLPQDFGVYPRGSAQELLNHLAILKGITSKKDRRDQVERLLVETNLYEVRKKRLATFSGGMRQRFGIAQALLGDPQLIIVDEPTAGLDPEERNRFHNLLSDIGENRVVILSTHIVKDVTDLCTQMAIMARGQVVAQGTPDSLIRALEGCVWRKAIAREALEATKAQHNVLSTHLSAGEMHVRIHAEACPGLEYHSVAPTLEDAYFFATLFGAPGNSDHDELEHRTADVA